MVVPGGAHGALLLPRVAHLEDAQAAVDVTSSAFDGGPGNGFRSRTTSPGLAWALTNAAASS